MNFMDWDDSVYKARYLKSIQGYDILRPNENIYFGFGKNGGTMLVIDDNYLCSNLGQCVYCRNAAALKQSCIDKRSYGAFNKYFLSRDFYIFILAFHQKLCLLYFSNKLAYYDKKIYKRKIEKLRAQLLKFTTQGWFSEITEDKVGSEFYKQWANVFESRQLYDEVYGQLSTVDDYYKTKRSNKFTLISAITFPVVIIGSLGSLYSSGYVRNSGDMFTLKWTPTTADGIAGAFNIGWGWFAAVAAVMAGFAAITFFKEKR
jgi:hypothetical protein